ncbi:hypothetical protein ACEPAG_386 [Sanghuangporus baumii]
MSALQPPHSHHSGNKQWWSRASVSKSSTMPAYRASDSSGTTTPTTPTSGTSQTYDDKLLKGSKQPKKFNTLASYIGIGFKSKKSHPTINIPSGPVSPPLPFQNPPPVSAPNSREPPPRPPRSIRPVTASSSSSYQYDPKSPGEPSIYTYPSSEEGAFEPLTPSDQLSRHRTSYQPSLFTFAEQQDQTAAALRLGDVSGSRYSPSDARRISVLSDPSVIDPHMRREQMIRSSRVSASSYYPAHQSEHKAHSGKAPAGLRGHRDSLERRKSSRDSLLSKEIDLTSDTDTSGAQTKPPEPRSRDQRHSDIPVPAVPKLSATMLLTAQRPTLRKSPSESVTAARPPGSSSGSRRPSPVPSIQGQSNAHKREGLERDRVTSLRNIDAPANEQASRASPATRPKAASLSAGSLSGSSAGGRPSPRINTSYSSATPLSRNASVTSGTGSAAGSKSSVVQRQQSISRLRAVPPSRNPPPSSNLPPTPQDKPPSPLTFRSPKNLSSSSLLNSPISISDDPSILAFDLPPSSPSSEASSASLSFAPTSQASMFSDIESSLGSAFRSSRNLRGAKAEQMHKPEPPSHHSVTPGSHTAKSSLSSNNTLMGTFTARGDTPVQRSVRKSMSQSSISLGCSGRGDRPELNVTAGSLIPEENPASVLHSMRTLRKQRSMHNTRAAGGSLALPPLPQQLRHVSSFNAPSVTEVSGSGYSSHTKGDSLVSPFGSQRRSMNSATPSSTAANSIVNTPTTPQTHKKRSIFSSHGRDRDRDRERRDSNVTNERESAGSAYSPDTNHNDKKKSHGIGLGLFSGHFSPSSSSSQIPDASDSRRPSSPTAESVRSFHPSSPPTNCAPPPKTDYITQHILPPKELLSQMEVLANMEAPSSPPQFSVRSLDDDAGEDYWEGSSIATVDKQSMRSRLDSLSGYSIASSVDENGKISKGDARSSTPSLTTRHFANASESIHEILEKERPSSSSRIPTRNVSGLTARSRVPSSSNTRPATADSFMRGFSSNGVNGDGYCPPTGLPPPPRRKGAVISMPTPDQKNDADEPMNPLSPPLPRNGASRLQRLPSLENQNRGLQRLSSYETISTYNPDRGSIFQNFQKPSFLNIEDEMNDQQARIEGKAPMTTVPEDSFLILEQGKDSIDLGRGSDELADIPFPIS